MNSDANTIRPTADPGQKPATPAAPLPADASAAAQALTGTLTQAATPPGPSFKDALAEVEDGAIDAQIAPPTLVLGDAPAPIKDGAAAALTTGRAPVTAWPQAIVSAEAASAPAVQPVDAEAAPVTTAPIKGEAALKAPAAAGTATGPTTLAATAQTSVPQTGAQVPSATPTLPPQTPTQAPREAVEAAVRQAIPQPQSTTGVVAAAETKTLPAATAPTETRATTPAPTDARIASAPAQTLGVDTPQTPTQSATAVQSIVKDGAAFATSPLATGEGWDGPQSLAATQDRVTQPLVATRPGAVATVAQTPLPPPDTMIAQIASQIRPGQGSEITIRLDPPELGALRIGLSIADGQVTAMVSAERGDVDAMLRRHGDQLSDALSRAGFGSVDLGFQSDQGGDGSRFGSGSAGPDDGPTWATGRTDPAVVETVTLATSGLDLRL